jgi:hypothetical protein
VESLIKASIHTSDFVNQNVANQNLTHSSFGHSGTKIT